MMMMVKARPIRIFWANSDIRYLVTCRAEYEFRYAPICSVAVSPEPTGVMGQLRAGTRQLKSNYYKRSCNSNTCLRKQLFTGDLEIYLLCFQYFICTFILFTCFVLCKRISGSCFGKRKQSWEFLNKQGHTSYWLQKHSIDSVVCQTKQDARSKFRVYKFDGRHTTRDKLD